MNGTSNIHSGLRRVPPGSLTSVSIGPAGPSIIIRANDEAGSGRTSMPGIKREMGNGE
jgi:hypothetical protein